MKFSFSSLRWWGSPQRSTPSQWTWAQIVALPVVDKDLTRGDNLKPQRIATAVTTASYVRVRVSVHDCPIGATE